MACDSRFFTISGASIMRSLFYASVAIVALAVPAGAFAQETTSSVRGSVTSEGAPVAGAVVTITHEPSGTKAEVTSDNAGSFSANGLRVGGPFNITIAAAGFEDRQVPNLRLSAGQALRLSVSIEPTSEIVVTASKTKTLEVSTGPITALGREEIDGVASINRDIRDLARRDPFVTMDLSNSRAIEIAGQNGRLNRFSVDGVQFSDDFGLNNGGLPTSRGPVPTDAIEQFSVKVAPFDISEGDFQGGAINVVLRSGGNTFGGSAFFTYTDDSLTGSKVRGSPVRLKFDSKQYGGLLSGPIIKDKLFFMVAYEKTEESDPFDDGVGAGFANQVPGVTQANIDQVTSIAKSRFNYDTLGLAPNAVEQDEKIIVKVDWNVSDDHRAAFTYIRNVGTQQFQQNTFTTAPFSIGLTSNGYELAEEVNSGVFQLNSSWSDNFSTEVRASYRDYNRDQTPFGGRNFAQVEVCLDPTSVGDIATTNGNEAISCEGTRVFFGPDVSRQANDLNTENLSVDFTGKLSVGAHTLKGTMGFTEINTFNLFLQRPLGDIYFDSLADFQGGNANRLRLANAVPSLDPNDAAAQFKTRNWTFGLQDDWDVTDNLQLTIGARYDLFDNDKTPPLNNNLLARVGFSNQATFKGRGVFQPRVGFNWQATDNLVIKGGVGIFAGGTPDVFISNSFSNTGQLTNALDISRVAIAAPATGNVRNLAGCGGAGSTSTPAAQAAAAALCAAALNGVTGTSFNPAVTNFLTTNTASLALAPVSLIDPNLKIARQMKAALSFDYDADLGPLGEGWLLGVQALYSKNIYGYTWTDLRSVPIGTLPDGRNRYGVLGTTPTNNQDLLMTNSTRGYSLSGVFRFAKSWDFGLSIDGSYTRNKTKDENALTSATSNSLYGNNAFFDPNRPAYGRSIYEIRNQFKFGVDFKRAFFGDNETRFSLFGEYRSGRPYSITALDNSQGRLAAYGTVGNGGRVLFYVPTGASDPLVTYGDTVVSGIVTQTAAQNAALLDTLITSNGLGRYRGRVVGKNSQRSPDFFKVDLHLEQEIPGFISSKSKFKIFADIENVLNLIDSDWGSLRQVSFPYTAPIARVACVAAGPNACAQYRYTNVLAPNITTVNRPSLYGIRVGAKFSF
jgi:Carboxypeptidase regulatory-like domain/TonB dependent receptor